MRPDTELNPLVRKVYLESYPHTKEYVSKMTETKVLQTSFLTVVFKLQSDTSRDSWRKVTRF